MRRIILVLSVIVLGGAAPARAWCEASCLAPTHDSSSHCPSHDPADNAAAISADDAGECPALESARTAAPARVDANTLVSVIDLPARTPSAIHAPVVVRPYGATTIFERSTPLRI